VASPSSPPAPPLRPLRLSLPLLALQTLTNLHPPSLALHKLLLLLLHQLLLLLILLLRSFPHLFLFLLLLLVQMLHQFLLLPFWLWIPPQMRHMPLLLRCSALQALFP
jgi:hypothetical protein